MELEDKQLIQQTGYGVVGMDLNIDHMAVCEIDDKGNIVNTKTYHYDIKNKRQNQKKGDSSTSRKAIVRWF